METFLVIGASGLLGQHLVDQGKSLFGRVVGTYNSNPFEMYGVEARKLDITSEQGVGELMAEIEPDFLIVTSALTGVDYCEEHPEEARTLNEVGPHNIAESCKELDIKLLHVSTDYVFDGYDGDYRENNEPNPVNVYGRTKLDGERAVLSAAPESIVARVCVLYGWNRITPKTNFVTWLLEKIGSGGRVELFEDQIVTPSYAHEVSQTLLKLITKDVKGIYHASGSQKVSRYEMGKLIANTFDLKGEKIFPTTMEKVGLTARRPRDSSLNVEKIEEEINTRMSPLPLSLEHMRDNQ